MENYKATLTLANLVSPNGNELINSLKGPEALRVVVDTGTRIIQSELEYLNTLSALHVLALQSPAMAKELGIDVDNIKPITPTKDHRAKAEKALAEVKDIFNPMDFYAVIGRLVLINNEMIKRNQQNPHLQVLQDLKANLNKIYEVSHLVDCPFDDNLVFTRKRQP